MKHKKTVFTLSCLIAITLFSLTNRSSFVVRDLMLPTETGSCWDTSSMEKEFDAKAILSQKFRFLGKGHQAFAFVSEDGEYVLKLFKPHYPRFQLFGQAFNLTPIPFAKWIYRTLHSKEFQQGIQEDFISYINARTKFQKESLVDYLHLAKTSHLQTKLQIFDKKGSLHTLAADDTCFLLQRKVTPLLEFLQTKTKEGKKEEIKIVFQNLTNLLARRAELGFCKPTHKFHINFGCIGLEIFQLDIGRLMTAEDLQLDPTQYPSQTLENSKVKLKDWVLSYCPQLIDCLPEENTL